MLARFVQRRRRNAGPVANGVGGRERREDGQGEASADETDRHGLEVAREAHRGQLPGRQLEATAVKNRNVIGSTGWLTIFGSIRRTNSPICGRPALPVEPDPEHVPRRPTKRLPRWITAPITAPMAGP